MGVGLEQQLPSDQEAMAELFLGHTRAKKKPGKDPKCTGGPMRTIPGTCYGRGFNVLGVTKLGGMPKYSSARAGAKLWQAYCVLHIC